MAAALRLVSSDMALDLTAPLPDLDGEGPAGANLEFDGEFTALERLAQGTPERQAGDKIIAAEDPVWKEVAAAAAALLERTYDLRVMVHLAVARLHTGGLGEFATVLTAIARMLADRWESVHPQLDPDDDNDPALRANALLPLAHSTRVLRALRVAPLATSKRAGPVSWRTIAISLGQVEAASPQEHQTESEIRAAFMDTPAPRVVAVRDHATAAVRAIEAIGAAFDSNSGYGNGPDLSALSKLLKEIIRFIGANFVEAAAEPVPEMVEEAASVPDDSVGGFALPVAGAAAPSGRGGGAVTAMGLASVATRTEALHLLNVVIRYYEQYEPSSPLSMMLSRARGLADKGFLEILQELAPDGVFQAQSIVLSREG